MDIAFKFFFIVIGLVLIFYVFVIVGSLVSAILGREEREATILQVLKDTQDNIFKRLHELSIQYGDVLARKRSQGIFKDEYGGEINDAWIRDCHYFYENVLCKDSIFNELNSQLLVLHPIRNEDAWLNTIFELIDSTVAAIPVPDIQAIETGQDYEVFCAKILEESAWIVRRTGRSGDQGVDLVAELNGISVAIQCKYYSSPVGNAAVQEIIAGKVFEKADHAAVVSNAAYTAAARQLASSGGVLLLHHDQLSQLRELVAG